MVKTDARPFATAASPSGPFDLAVVIGSLREASLSRQVARAAIALAPPRWVCREVALRELPLYDADLESPAPAAWTEFRAQIAAARAILFVTPEYNRSIPGGLKNAIDVGSQPEELNAWERKPCAVISVAPNAQGGVAANHALRQCLVGVDAPVMQQPEAYIGDADALFDADGALKHGETHALLTRFMATFEQWVAMLAAPRCHRADPPAERER